MAAYFNEEESMTYRGIGTKGALRQIALHYMARNPPLPFVFRLYPTDAFQYKDGLHDLDFSGKFPGAGDGAVCYAFSLFYKDCSGSQAFLVRALGRTEVYVNHQRLCSLAEGEEETFILPFTQGINSLFVRCVKSDAGFGCRLGAANARWEMIHVRAPFKERAGIAGWVYTAPAPCDSYSASSLPAWDGEERGQPVEWLPAAGHAAQACAPDQIFARGESGLLYMWCRLKVHTAAKAHHIRLNRNGGVKIWLDHRLIVSKNEGTEHIFYFAAEKGCYDFLIEYEMSPSHAFDISPLSDTISFEKAHDIKGMKGRWLYAGPFSSPLAGAPEKVTTLYTLLDDGTQQDYWRADSPDTYVRPFLENDLFGKWNYPLGVTLYGLLKVSRFFGKADIEAYVKQHVFACTTLHWYSVWDEKQYGCPAVNNQLVEMSMLDDCGSFGSAMLETDTKDAQVRHIAHRIADYMANTQERREDGAFYRSRPGTYSENTLWADDLYMSVPFLCRYYKLTGDERYINDAVNQFLLFCRYLLIDGPDIMSHVYYFNENKANGIPWGRGNGWVLFSLAELLETIAQEHAKKEELLALFRRLSAGYVRLQGTNGLWHQVLTQHDSYEETSCSAMFIYSFSKGIRLGWLDRGVYEKPIKKAWKAILSRTVDRYGNVYGVCGGSRCSFDMNYYKNELGWILNDTHGVGIVLLAGIEFLMACEE